MSDEESDDIEVRYLAANGYDYHAALVAALRQLTQAREALEKIPHMAGRHHDGLLVGCPGCIARQALATITEGETEA